MVGTDCAKREALEALIAIILKQRVSENAIVSVVVLDRDVPSPS